MTVQHDRTHDRLRDWLGIFHPAYRSYLAAMVAIGVLGGILTYFNLEFLQGLVKTYGALDQLGGMACIDAREVHFLTGFIVCNGLAGGWGIVVLVLLAYIALELLIAANGILRMYVEGYLDIASRADIEREILLNLMRKDDEFFQRNSATQITNRLSEDTERMFGRREDMSEIWAVTVEALGALYFLWAQNWSYAGAVLVFSLGGVFFIHRMLAKVKALDGEQLASDDNVKATFEDYLQAAPEVQMANLSGRITAGLAKVQRRRRKAHVGLLQLNARLNATYDLTELIAFAAIMGAIIYVVLVHGLTLEDGLVAAVVRAVPQTYGNISELAKLFMKFQLADVSAKRLMEFETLADATPEYDAAGASSGADAAGPAQSANPNGPLEKHGVAFDAVKYAFVPGGSVQGGEDGMALKIAPRSLNIVVGPSGSGKSMLGQLLMGRLKPLSGQVQIAGKDIASLPRSRLAEFIAYMPQSLAVISGSIADNIEFGQPDDAGRGTGLGPNAATTASAGSGNDLTVKWIERSGVGRFAREKALDLNPRPNAEPGPADMYAADLTRLRSDSRRSVEALTGVAVVAFGSDRPVPHFLILEHLASSVCQLDALVDIAFSSEGFDWASDMTSLHEADAIAAFGAHVVERTRNMLIRCPSADAYNELAPNVLHEEVWDLRKDLAGVPEFDPYDPSLQGALLLAGLTARPLEGAAEANNLLFSSLSAVREQQIGDECHEFFADALEALSEDKLSPWLCWRDNLLFGFSDVANAAAAPAIDQALLKAVAGTAQDAWLLDSGLSYDVGRQGRKLSGGQRQLVCLCRTLAQSSPILVLDEPTSALDPAKRSEVNLLLREIARERIVVVVTHDANFARLADQVIVVTDGRIAATGECSVLQRESDDFRRITGLGLGSGLEAGT